MNFRDYLFDNTFLVSIWPHIWGSISQGITTSILLVGLWLLSDSSVSFFTMLQSGMGRIIGLSIFLVILINVALSVMEFGAIKYYLLSPPVTTQSLKQISNENRRTEYFFKYIGPSIIFFIAALDFLKLYFIDGVRGEALRSALMFVLPFTIALVTTHFSRILVEMGILFLRFIIQLLR